MADDLVARLLEAIAETERIAQAAGTAWTLEGGGDELLLDFGTHTTSDIGFYDDDALRPAEARHIVRQNPKVTLDRCAADRKILDLFTMIQLDPNPHDAGPAEGAYTKMLHVLAALAEAYGVEP